MGWIRPENVAFPKVWLKFQAKDVESDNFVEYRVQDLPEDHTEDAVNYLLENFLDDEPFVSSKKFREDPEALAEFTNFWRKHFTYRSTLVCFKENSNEIVGINLNAVVLECDKNKKYQKKSKKLHELMETDNFVMTSVDVFEKFKVDAYLTAFGLSVSRKYRGRGIATEILRARIPFCQAFGIKLTSTVFTSIFAQRSAAKVGFKEIFSITREQLAEENAMYYMKNLTVECLLMALEIPEK